MLISFTDFLQVVFIELNIMLKFKFFDLWNKIILKINKRNFKVIVIYK